MDPDRLRRLLDLPELAWLVERLRQRVERGQELRGTVRLSDPSPAQRRAVDRLFGRSPSAGKAVAVHLDALEALLRHAEVCDSLRQAINLLAGPLVDRRALKARREREWRQLLDEAAGLDPRPQIRAWLGERRTHLQLRRYCRRQPAAGHELLTRAFAVIRRLPAAGIPLAALAAEAAGDSHALDVGQPLGALVLGAASRLAGQPDPATAGDRREVWEAVGIAQDDLSASVLVLGLRAAHPGGNLTSRVLDLHAEAGEPCRLTTGQLLRHPPSFDLSTTPRVHVCENPAVVSAAARRLHGRALPLLCADGQATLAVHRLLSLLATAGIPLLYHGDFDGPGLAIARHLFRRYPFAPWRFTTPDYLAAPAGPPLQGSPGPSPWDPALSPAMARRGVGVHEEQVLEELLGDLTS